MASSILWNPYAYCRDCQKPYRYIGYDLTGKSIMACPKCGEKRAVPKEWVRGLTPVKIHIPETEEAKFKNKMMNKMLNLKSNPERKRGK